MEYCAEFAKGYQRGGDHADKSPESEVIRRMMLILLLVAVAEILVVLFVPKPLPWVVLIPVLIPLLTSFLIILPIARAEKTTPPSV